MSSSMVAPALDVMGTDLDIPSSFGKQLILSIFVLTYGVGPIVIGPLSELYGTCNPASFWITVTDKPIVKGECLCFRQAIVYTSRLTLHVEAHTHFLKCLYCAP